MVMPYTAGIQPSERSEDRMVGLNCLLYGGVEMSQNFNEKPDVFGAVMPRPMSLFEREDRAKELREEAAKLIAEAERIEVGCASDRAEFNKAVEAVVKNMKIDSV